MSTLTRTLAGTNMPEVTPIEASAVDKKFTGKSQIELLAITLDLMHAQMGKRPRWNVSLEHLAKKYRVGPAKAACRAEVEARGRAPSTDVPKQVEEAWRLEHRHSLARLAAHMAVRNQIMSFAVPGIDEETHTAALFGMLANTLSLATVLAPSQPKGAVAPENAGCYWAHQSKITEEPKSGIDFGIITDLSNELVKLTLFQAKRPKDKSKFLELKYGHPVRKGKPTKPDIFTAYKQKRLLDRARSILRNGDTLQQVAIKLCGKDLYNDAILTGNESLFSPRYSYEQITAFLATALRGEDHGQIGECGWCFYVQWPYGSRRAPWTAPLIDVLRAKSDPAVGLKHIDFAAILSLALSPETNKVGLVLPKNNIETFAEAITGLMPYLTWGAISDSEDGAEDLIQQVSVGNSQLRQIRQSAPAQAASPSASASTSFKP